MGRGRRYEVNSPKLNIKKVIATIVIFVIIIVLIIYAKKMISNPKPVTNSVSIATAYFPTYTNGKWGVIDNNGETIINNVYDEMVIVPEKNTDLFICTYNVDYNSDTYETKVVNKLNSEILTEYKNVQAIENSKGNEIWYENNILKFKKDNKIGLIDFKGKLILEAEYDSVYALEGIEKNIIIEKDGKVGLVNTSMGEIIVEPIYDEITTLVKDSYESGYIVKKDNKYGIISADSKIVFDTTYDGIQNVVYDGYYVVVENNVKKLVNPIKTQEVILNYEQIKEINNGNIVVMNGNKYGVIDMEGNSIIALEYDDLTSIFENNYIAKKDGKYGIISKENQVKINFDYTLMEYIKTANFIEADTETYKTDIIDKSLKVVLQDIIISDLNLEKGYMRIRKDNDYKYYNFNFQEQQPQEVLTTSTLFLVKENGKYGYENKKGDRIVNCIYDDAKEQNQYGYCAIKRNGTWGALKSDGTVILTPSLNLDENLYIDFIGTWHLDKNLELNVYTK